MSTPRELSRIANRIAGKMTDDGSAPVERILSLIRRSWN